MDTLLQALDNWQSFTALVVGDFMLDQLLHGDAERLAPDAPVPVLQIRSEVSSPGGAANLCMDLEALQASVIAVGVTGEDSAGHTLRAQLKDANINPAGLVTDPTRPTTVKRSYVGLAQHRHPQKMFRADFESRAPISETVAASILAQIRAHIQAADIVCIEDYNKGVCTPELCRAIIDIAQEHSVPVLVDPARIESYTKYHGATAITPNRTEAEVATGKVFDNGDTLSQSREMADTLASQVGGCVVLTLDRMGALVRDESGTFTHVPTVARQVYDVTGAGDMFLAGLAAARANKLSWEDSVRFANAAAGLEVEVFGTRPIPLNKVHASLLAISGRVSTKVRSVDEAAELAHQVQSRGGTVVFTNGCFDILHAGHVWLLDKAKAEGDLLIVATNTDEKVRQYKGPTRPVNALEQRLRVLCGLAAVDAVVVFPHDTPMETIGRIKPDVLVKGDEYTEGEIPGAAFVISNGGRVVRIPMLEGESTTAVLKAMGDERWKTATTRDDRDRFIRDTSR
ncbi:MAG: bifunctional heptose 7-phosphate kinase/heptose 1-phosphate adenyltransferase [Phycisphaeraceae bacterium]|nr:bifunctional heptose 7-phosphate kinase/heptose 1-phosphate adenyltransferase [Phycisphaerales bacterium]MCB9859921.1 bifunctional heptose 7-phosphate kinase/heptose 1-phosphate adenyltransferase [Phycisphaeraceae bacterium]